jgi:hypothetical protein
MKKKDVIALLLAVTIFLVAGYIALTQLAPKNESQVKGVEVEVIGVIPASLDDKAKSMLQDGDKVQDFHSPVDFTGLNNPAPFGP